MPDDTPEMDDPLDTLYLNGETFEFESMTFGERKKVMKVAGQLAQVEDPDADPATDWTRDDMRLAFAIVCSRRSNPDFSLEDGLEMTPAALEVPPTPAKPRRKTS